MPPIELRPLQPDAAGELLTRSSCLAARAGSRLVGAVRAHERDGVLHVGRLIVAPDLQGRGVGTRLLAAERTTRLVRAPLFTGARSTADLRLYRRHGYVDAHRETVRRGLEPVHLVEALR
ncbi:MAG TPA: GNAT family N-acetyltransferase [Geodermatophilus sp.]|nr:GNAT family N-acetyltransferase [Geodermatophilus sp.]